MQKPIEIGKIVNTHGLKGEVKVTPWCDDPSVFNSLDCVFTGNAALKIQSVKFHKNSVILKLEGVDRIEDAEKLKNSILSVERSSLGQLPQNTYYVDDLIGMEVFAGEQSLGIIDDCFATGSNDVYSVKGSGGKQLLIPAIKQVVKRVDVESRRMDIELIEGLLDEN